MKKRHLLFFLALLLNMAAYAENIAQAIWTEGNTTLTFLSSENLYAQGDDLNGQTVTNVWSGEDVTNSPTIALAYPRWLSSVNSSLTTVVFDESFKDVRPQSTAYWFSGCSKLQSIEGIENLNTENVTSMSLMFDGCSGLTSLDVSSFNTQNVTYMNSMFWSCSGLTSLDVSGFNTQNVTYMGNMFSDCSGLTSLDVSGFNTQNVTDMISMFSGCSGLTSLDVSGFNTQNVTYMDNMFSGCSSLTSLDVSGFNTQNVTTMGGMFSGCNSLTSLDVSGFNTQNVRNMYDMFSGCSNLTSLDVSGFNTQNVTSMNGMFSGCSSLTALDVSGFNTQNVTSMEYMFSGCSGLTTLNVSSFNTQNVTRMELMFYGCSSLTTLDVSGFNTQNVTDMRAMFYGCSSLTALDLSSFNTQNVTDMDYMFYGCSGLTSLNLSGFNTQNVTEMSSMFYDTGSAIIFIPANTKEEILSQRDFNMVLKAEDGSFSCANFIPVEDIEFDIPYTFTATISNSDHLYNGRNVIGWNTKADGTGITYMAGQENATIYEGKTTFYPIYVPEPQAIWTAGNTTLTFLSSEKLYAQGEDFNGQTVTEVWSGENVTNSLTYGDPVWISSVSSSLTNVVFDESFKDVKPQSTAYWFYECSKLQSIEGIENLNTENVTSMSSMFSGCSGLTSLDVSGFNTQNVTNMAGMFRNCSGLTSLDVSGFNTQKVTYMDYMFSGCSGLTSLDVSGFNTQNVTSMDGMFSYCSGLTSLDLSSFNTQNVANMSFMFDGCSGLTSLDLSSFNTQNVTEMSSMFYNTGSAIIFIPANTKEEILSQRDFNMVLKAEDGSFSCANFVPAEDIEFDIPYTFTATITNSDHLYNSRHVIGWNTKADGTGITYQVGQENATIHKGRTTFYPIYPSEPQAIWTEGNTTLTFLSSEKLYAQGEDFNGQTVTEVWSGENVTNSPTWTRPTWISSVSSSLTTVVFDESFKDVKPQSTAYWFGNCSKLQTIEGIENLNTENVTRMDNMFLGCSGLTSLDVSGFNTQNVTSMDGMFSNCSGLTSLDVSGFNTQNVTNMRFMFYACSGLTSLDVSGFDTQDVVDMYNMFSGCSNLTSLDVSGFNTQNVTLIAEMFSGCRGLTSLNVSGFNTQNVEKISSMFSGCSGLTSLDVSGFNTQNVKYMSSMFSGCSGLTSLDVSGFNTQNVGLMFAMFQGCSGLTSLDVSGFNTQNVTSMYYMFSGCSGLTSLDVSGFNTQNVTNMRSMFSGCSGLTTLDLSGFNTQNVENMSFMFTGCSGLTSLDVSGFNTQNVTSMSSMFSNTGSAIIFIPADTKQEILSQRGFNMVLKAADGSFSCANFIPAEDIEFDIPYTFTATISNSDHLYNGRNVIGWNTKADGTGITYMAGQENATIYEGKTTFYPIYVHEPQVIWTAGNTTLTFLNSETVYASGDDFNGQTVTNVWSGEGVTNSRMPRWLSSVSSSLTTVVFDESFKDVKPQSTAYWFRNCSKLQTIEGIENLNTENVTDMSDMFYNCSGLTTLDLSSFNTQNVRSVSYMLYNTGSAIIFIPADANQGILSQRDFNMVLKAADGSFSCANFIPIENIEFDIPYTFTATITDNGHVHDSRYVIAWNTKADGTGITYQTGQTEAVIYKGKTTFYPTAFGSAPQAVWTEGNTTLTFLNSETVYASGDDFNGQTVTNVWSGEDVTNSRTWSNPMWLSSVSSSLTTVVFDESFKDVKPQSTAYWFRNCSKLQNIEGIENLNTENVTNMSSMFYNCSGLTTLDLSSFNTQNVTYMSSMLYNTDSAIIFISADANQEILSQKSSNMVLKAADGSFSCANFVPVEDIEFDIPYTFTATITDNGHVHGSRYVIGWNTKADGTGIAYQIGQTDAVIYKGKTTFYPTAFDLLAQVVWTEGNTTLTFLNSETVYVSGDDFNGQTVTNVWSGENVTNSPTWTSPTWISSVSSSLTTVVFDESFKDVKPQSTASWFSGCSKLQSIEGIENLNTENVTNMSAMFSGCRGLTSLDVSGFNTQNVTNMNSMFSGCSGLTSLDVSGFNTQNVTDMSSMFYSCRGLTSINVSSFNTQNVTNMSAMFYNCSGLTSLDVSSFNTQNVTSMGSMFSRCSGLTTLDVSGFNTENVTDMGSMFYGCSGLTTLDLSSFNTQNVTNMTYMFRNCSGLTSLDVSGFNTENVTDMHYMFLGCSGLTTLDLSSFNTQNVTNMTYMFRNTGSAIIFIPADAQEGILSQRDFNMVLKAADGSFSCENFVPIDSVELNIPYAFTATLTSEAPQKEGLTFTGWNTMSDGSGTNYVPGQTDAVIEKGLVTFYPIFDDPTNIQMQQAERTGDTRYYNLRGMRMEQPRKGLNITVDKNGRSRKVMMR